MKARLFIINLLIILILLFLSGLTYAQDREIGIKIAVLPFQNVSDFPEYDYLSQSMQKSIYASISQQEGIIVIPNRKASDGARKVGLNIDTINNASTTLRFALEVDINVIIMGDYSIEKDSNKLRVNASIYSIAQKEYIIEESYESLLDGEEYDLIDKLAVETSTEVKKRKEEIEIALEDIRENITPPEYVKEPHISEVTFDGVVVDWQTTKETVSTLYVGFQPDFEITEDTPAFQDESENAINHSVVIGYNILNPKSDNEYYFKSIDQDFFDNVKKGEPTKVPKEEIYEELKVIYENQVDELYLKMEEHIENKNFEQALTLYTKISDYNETFETLVEVREDKQQTETKKKQLKQATEVMNIMTDANNLAKLKEFESAMERYEKALQLIIDENIEHLISAEILNNEINRMNAAIKVMGIIEEGDLLAEEEEYEKADEKYKESIEKIKENDIDDLISIEEVADKIKGEYEIDLENNSDESDSDNSNNNNDDVIIPDYEPSTLFIRAGSGVFFNPIDITDGVFISWDASFNMRFNKVLSLGVGINTFSVDLFMNISPVNKKKFEYFIKVNAVHTFLPEALAIGGGLGTGIVFRFNDLLGMSIDVNSWALYFYPDQIEDTEGGPVVNVGPDGELGILVFANIGIIINF